MTTPQPQPPTPTPRQRLQLRALAPYVSLGLGLASAALTQRHPGRALWICAFAAIAWLAHFAWLLLERRRTTATSAAVERAARWASAALAQSMAQSLLWFALPWLWRAAAPAAGQLAYLALLVAIAICSLWDPLWQRLMAVPAVAAFFLAGATFAGLAATLPMVGVPLGQAPWWAAAAAAAPALLHVLGEARWRQPATWTLAQLAALPWILLAGPLRVAVPPAPLALEEVALVEGVVARAPGPPLRLDRLPAHAYCFTAVSAPAGVHAALRHVWRRDGEGLTRRELAMRGGRVGGFRTWSRHPAGQLRSAGEVECRVETLAGQPLGAVTVERERR